MVIYSIFYSHDSIHAIIGYYLSTQKNIPNKKMWWISFFLALIVSLFIGTAGILISEMTLRGNLNTLNIEDSMIWGVIYSFVLLPITVPSRKFILNSFALLDSKIRNLKII
ncbi:hypothetical protein ACFVT8_06220 [Lysinibacillus sp. NPDC058147]|uniref:hypothetical protein n=1 Tax=unclassified Lysinibacillus TaxID=2636778 RepID=UPI0036D75E44